MEGETADAHGVEDGDAVRGRPREPRPVEFAVERIQKFRKGHLLVQRFEARQAGEDGVNFLEDGPLLLCRLSGIERTEHPAVGFGVLLPARAGGTTVCREPLLRAQKTGDLFRGDLQLPLPGSNRITAFRESAKAPPAQLKTKAPVPWPRWRNSRQLESVPGRR